MRFNRLFLTGVLAAPLCHAVLTGNWTQQSRADFEKGTMKGLSIRSDGRLTLAPVMQEVFDPSAGYLWSVAEGPGGEVYVGGGGPADDRTSLFVVPPSGEGRKLADLKGFQIQALAVSPSGEVFVATAPDGLVYRVRPDGSSEVFFDPKAKYVWALAFHPGGDLFVATGDSGKVFRVRPDGQSKLYFDTQETHARSLAVRKDGVLFVGTEPGGLLFRVDAEGKGFAVHQAERREVTAVAIAPDGAIYFAAAGGRRQLPAAPAQVPAAVPLQTETSGREQRQEPRPGQPESGVQVTATSAIPLMPAAPSGGSDLYRVENDGYAHVVWRDERAMIYAIAFDRQGRPVLGTGNEGGLYRVEDERVWTLLAKAEPRQITALTASRDGGILAVTGNPGKLYRFGPGLEDEGSFESEVFDAGLFSRWGRMRWRLAPNGGSVRFAVRSGNLDRPQRNWSDWAEVQEDGDGGLIAAPAARFLQYRVTMRASASGLSPELIWVDAAYQTRNVAPVFSEIELTPPNYAFPPRTLTLSASRSLTLPPLGQSRRAPQPRISQSSSSQSLQYQKGAVGVRWLASDPNGDSLRYRVEIRAVEAQDWLLLKDQLEDSYFSWDGGSFPDGEYVVRVTASDDPDNPPDKSLSAQIVSDPFRIDNTAPVVTRLTAARAGGRVRLTWQAEDAASVITKAEYSVNGGPWLLAAPETGLSDSKCLSYAVTLESGAPGELVIAVRVTDAFDNQTVEKTILR